MPEAITGYFSFGSRLLESVRAALVGEALSDIAAELKSLRDNLEPESHPETLKRSLQRFEELFAQFRDRLKAADQERADDFRKILVALNEAFGYLSAGAETSDGRLRKLESSLQQAAKMEDLGTLKTHLAQVLQSARRDAARERQQARTVLESLGTQIRHSQKTASFLEAGLGTREDAMAELTYVFQETGAKEPMQGSVFVVDALKRLVSLHSEEIADHLLAELARKEIQPTAPAGRLFRWSPTSVLLLWQGEQDGVESRDAASKSPKSLFEYRAFLGSRIATFKVGIRSLSVPLRGPFDEVIAILDNFAN